MFVLDLTRIGSDRKSVVFPGQIHSVCDPLIIERVLQIEFFYSNHTLFTVNLLKISLANGIKLEGFLVGCLQAPGNPAVKF